MPLAEARGWYESLAPFEGTFSTGRPALLYHKVDWLKRGVRRRGLYVSPTIFRKQMLELRDAGFFTPTLAEFMGPLDRKQLLITFDDGFANVLDHALPVLEECRFHAVQFLVPGLHGQTNVWDAVDGERPERLMTVEEIRTWLAAGHEIGAHTMSHPRLTRLSLAQAKEEIVASKRALEDQFQRPVSDFAYPFGDFNDGVRDLVAEAGFARAWTIEPGVNQPSDNRFALLRFPVVASLRRPMNLLRSIRWPLARKRQGRE